MADKLMRTTVLITFFMVLALFSGCGARDTLTTASDNGREITLQQGRILSVILESNPTTGYSWQVLQIDNKILAQDGDPEYTQAAGSEGLVGAGGTQTYHFKAASTGKVTLVLGYMRPWEDVPPTQTFTLTVNVE